MGGLLEALWGYHINQVLLNEGGEAAACEIGWLACHGYNDFACILRDAPWTIEERVGELFRIEAKSMNVGADESKGHFDELVSRLNANELLLVLVWSWDPVDEFRVYPHIRDYFIGSALSVAVLRDRLHIARGGTFVDRAECPDRCAPDACIHQGEPLNASGKRERLSGPVSTRPSATVSYAANFGGLVRMLKTNSPAARDVFRSARANDPVAHAYISFIHRNYPDEESNQYLLAEWKILANRLELNVQGINDKQRIIAAIRSAATNYRDLLRDIFVPDGGSSNLFQ
jgi:hypothetical protein